MTSKTFLGVVAGAAIGVTAGLLFAPKKGEKTRKKLSKEAKSIKDDLVKEMSEVGDTVEELLDSQKETFNKQMDSFVTKASHKADGVISKLEESLKTLKEKNKKYHNGVA